MAEVRNEMIYGMLKAMPVCLGNMAERIRELRGVHGSAQAVRQQVSAVQTDIGNLYETYGASDTRPSRIARRLDIVASPVA